MGRKSDSGAAKRKRKKQDETLLTSMKGSLLRHLRLADSASADESVTQATAAQLELKVQPRNVSVTGFTSSICYVFYFNLFRQGICFCHKFPRLRDYKPLCWHTL